MTTQPSRRYSQLAVAIVVGAVVIGAGIVASSYVGTTTTVTRTSTATTTAASTTTVTTAGNLTQPCSVQVWNTNSSSTNANVPVLLMQPESTALICVTYQSAWHGNASQFLSAYFVNDTYHFSLEIGKEHCVTNATETACTSTISHSFAISALPSSIQPSVTTNYVTVVYVVNSLSNSTGFYDFSAPFDYCSGMPMAVGYTASEVNASDFAPRMVIPCPFLPFVPSSVSVEGMNATYISF